MKRLRIISLTMVHAILYVLHVIKLLEGHYFVLPFLLFQVYMCFFIVKELKKLEEIN